MASTRVELETSAFSPTFFFVLFYVPCVLINQTHFTSEKGLARAESRALVARAAVGNGLGRRLARAQDEVQVVRRVHCVVHVRVRWEQHF